MAASVGIIIPKNPEDVRKLTYMMASDDKDGMQKLMLESANHAINDDVLTGTFSKILQDAPPRPTKPFVTAHNDKPATEPTGS